MTIVFKVSDLLKEKMVAYYQDKRKEKTPPYALFQAMDADTMITLYESGKAMFQGKCADMDAKMWAEMERNLTGKRVNLSEAYDRNEKIKDTRRTLYGLTTIGSDEVGTGDFFGPIVVTACYVPKEQVPYLDQLGVRDSKTITDKKIIEIAPTLMKEVSHVTFILRNEEYNRYQSMGYNMNKIKAILHNKVLVAMKKKHPSYDRIVVDQFVFPRKYFEHISQSREKVKDIMFLTKAESVCASVAAASCISRYIFLKEMKSLGDHLGFPLLKGAGEDVDRLAAKIVTVYGEEKLPEIAKMNFKNADKYFDFL